MPAARRPLLAVDATTSPTAPTMPYRNLSGGREIAAPVPFVGFANFLLRRERATRAVLVGWDTLDAPTYRQTLFPGYHGGREFDDELVGAIGRAPGICRCRWLRRRQSARL